LRSTFEHIIGPDFDNQTSGPVINSDLVVLWDHLPYYTIDYDLSRDANCAKHFGQNMLLDNCVDASNTIWIYNQYLRLESTTNNIYVPAFDYFIETFYDPLPLKKNRKYKFVSFNNKPRHHRVLTSAWVNKNFTPYDYFHTCLFNAEQDGITAHLQFIDNPGSGLPKKDLLLTNENIDGRIFRDTFYPISRDSVFNIVNEVSFFEHGATLTEKTLWAILSYNIPIVSGYGMATCMEQVGFDMFRDIVNYSGEYEKNPFKRTQHLLDSNREVLKNAHDFLTPEIISRLEYNFELLQTKNINQHAVEKLNSPEMLVKLYEIMYNNNEIKHYIKDIIS